MRRSGGCSFPPSGDWASGNPSFRHIARVPRHATPGAWARLPVSWHAAVPFTSRIRVSHQTHRHLLQSMPAARAIQAVRLVAHRRYEASGGDRRVDLLRGRGRAESAPAEGPDLGPPRAHPGGHGLRQGLRPGVSGRAGVPAGLGRGAICSTGSASTAGAGASAARCPKLTTLA